METISVRQPINLKVVRFQLDFTPPLIESKPARQKKIRIPKIHYQPKQLIVPAPPLINFQQKRDVKDLVDQLLEELYCSNRGDWNSSSGTECRGPISVSSFTSSQYCKEKSDAIEKSFLEQLELSELRKELADWQLRLEEEGLKLARCARARDRLRRKQKRICAAFSILLRHLTGDSSIRFSVSPATDNLGPGEGGYGEWLHAMRLVARLPAGVPQHFRKKLWLTLSDRYLKNKGVDWTLAERACFRGTAQPDDTELGAQILKDLHRTGCSLFCGTEGRENQAMLRRVLLAYARWNKEVGYCQGFNMLAAIILEVMEKSESDSLKVMIYLVEAVLPEGYFADDLRGLSADMAAFRDLLRLRLPRLAQHMDHLQKISDGGGVEPPLPDVFTMQWFLTLYATWLPRESLLRIWDLVLLDGNEILLLTALAIWDMLQDRILSARSADEYYSSMGGGAGAVWEASEALVARVVALGSAPELPRLRNIHRYRVAPPVAPIAPTQPPFQSAMQSMTKRGLRLFYSEDEGDSSDDGSQMALATVIPRRDERVVANDRLSLDIGALKRQYARLRERQRQAHVILAAACARHAAVGVPTSPTSLTVNNLLLGKSAIVSTRGRRLGPPPGAIPPSRRKSREPQDPEPSEEQADTISWNEEHNRKSISRRNSVKWKDIKKEQEIEKARKTSIDFDETGDGVIVSEREANEMMKSLRTKSCDESSSYSSHSESSSDTSLCDNDKDSDSEPEIAKDSGTKVKETKQSPKPSKSSPDIVNEVLKTERATSSTTDIASFIKSSAGEPLRDYIGAFEYKLKESNDTFPSVTGIDFTKLTSPLQDNFVLEDIENKSSSAQSHINFTDLSPIDILPYALDVNEKSPIKFNLEQSFKRPQNIDLDVTFSQPDIIDSFTKYPNFVPDIDLSERNISDIESPPRSLDSVVVSEDEPPIPLKIDKYFEDSPEFFGARITVTDSNNTDIQSRRPSRRQFRISKQTDSLNIQRSTDGQYTTVDTTERASSMPHSQSFSEKINKSFESPIDFKSDVIVKREEKFTEEVNSKKKEENVPSTVPTAKSPTDLIISGRKNSEKALQIIQENSKILSRILTKQSMSSDSYKILESDISSTSNTQASNKDNIGITKDTIKSPTILKESNSDSLIRYRKSYPECKNEDKNTILLHKSLDEPYNVSKYEFKPDFKSPSLDDNVSKTVTYGWENKGFLARCDPIILEDDSNPSDITCSSISSEPLLFQKHQTCELSSIEKLALDTKDKLETSILPETNQYPYLSKYTEYYTNRTSDIYSSAIPQGPSSEHKIEDSQVSDFAHVVTSSISFTYERSADDESPAKSNSSDTLCQITSLDQVSTPISPKIFPRDTQSNTPKDFMDKSERTKDSDDTCSAITSLLDSDTLSSISYPRSPSTGSFYPFPTRPGLRMPKEIGVRLGMYPKDKIESPTK